MQTFADYINWPFYPNQNLHPEVGELLEIGLEKGHANKNHFWNGKGWGLDNKSGGMWKILGYWIHITGEPRNISILEF